MKRRNWNARFAIIALGVAACGCGTPTPTNEATSALQPTPLGDGIDSLMYFLDDSTGPAGGGDWDYCHGKATCAGGDAIAAVSEIPGGPNRRALCRAGESGNFTGQVAATLFSENGEQRRAARLGDWAYGYTKLECAIGEYVSAVSEDASGCQGNNAFHGIQCAAGSNIVSSTCTARTVDSGDSRAFTDSGDWDYGANKAECGPASYVAGVSLGSNGALHSILCCARPGGPGGTSCGQQLYDSVDLLSYFCPDCVGAGSTRNHIVDGECFNTQARTVNNRAGFRIGKSCSDASDWEDFAYDGSWLYHLGDTTWTVPCSDDGSQAMTLYFDGATAGGKWVPRYMAVGDNVWMPFVVTGRHRDSCGDCPTSQTGATGHSMQLVYHKTMDILGTCRDVVRLAISGGPGYGENYWYAQGLGWIGYAVHDPPTDPTLNFWTQASHVDWIDGARLGTSGCTGY